LALRGFQIVVISFVAKLPHASSMNILGRVQLENRREAKRFKSPVASFPANAAFCSVGNHGQNLLQLQNQADNAARGSML
jgi:hypothetical protein